MASINRWQAVWKSANVDYRESTFDEDSTFDPRRIVDLLKRHGSSVATVMRDEMLSTRLEPAPSNSLPDLYGVAQRGQLFTSLPVSPEQHNELEHVFDIVIDKKRKALRINDAIQITGAGFNLLNALAREFLQGAGQGLDPLDFPTLNAGKLAVGAGLQDEAAVRQSVSRTRKLLGTKFASAELDPEEGKNLIESLPWSGYRLQPDRVRVRYRADN